MAQPKKKPAPPDTKALVGPPENKAAAATVPDDEVAGNSPAPVDPPTQTKDAPAPHGFGFLAPTPSPKEG